MGWGGHGANITHWMPLWDVIDPFLLLTGGNLHNRPAESVTVGSFKIMRQSSHITDTVQEHKTLEPPLESNNSDCWRACVCVCVCSLSSCRDSLSV